MNPGSEKSRPSEYDRIMGCLVLIGDTFRDNFALRFIEL